MKSGLLAVALLAATSGALQAQTLGYSYLEGGYTRLESDVDLEGFGLNGSLALDDQFHLFGGLSRTESDDFADLDRYLLGIGYHRPLGDRLHLLTRIGYSHEEPQDADSYGRWFSEAGARYAIGRGFEGWLLAGYEDGDDVDGGFYGKLGGQFGIGGRDGLARWGIVTEIKWLEDDRIYFIGPRLEF